MDMVSIFFLIQLVFLGRNGFDKIVSLLQDIRRYYYHQHAKNNHQ